MYSLGELEVNVSGSSSTNSPHFAKLSCRSFQNRGPKKISYLCVLVKNGNSVYNEWFRLELVKKIKPALKHQGQLPFRSEMQRAQPMNGCRTHKETLVNEGEGGT